jgi:hypothetical protein
MQKTVIHSDSKKAPLSGAFLFFEQPAFFTAAL